MARCLLCLQVCDAAGSCFKRVIAWAILCFPRFSSGDLSVTISAGTNYFADSLGQKEIPPSDPRRNFLLHRSEWLFRAEERRKYQCTATPVPGDGRILALDHFIGQAIVISYGKKSYQSWRCANVALPILSH